jgi:DNA invertase Pin-like site-specific DNA recombinase
MNPTRKIRCAVYTRKSHEEGLEQEFNSLDAQRDACEKYIQSQRGEGWILIPDHYDDGGFTGGNTDRPALQKLLHDIETGLIDVVVVYKIDRLSRSLLDFLNMVRMFDKRNVSFVSVTQQFNTSTPMGRLMINVLMSFAEYEREVTGERIRDKIASSKQKGMWMGGFPPLGYDIKNRKLVINEGEADVVGMIFREMSRHSSMTLLIEQMSNKGFTGKAWTTVKGVEHKAGPLNKSTLYKMLRNPIYIGKIRHKKEVYPGEHAPIINEGLWNKVQAVLSANNPKQRSPRHRVKSPHMLRGIIFDAQGHALTPSHTTKKNGKQYRYYVSTRAIKRGYKEADIACVPANQIEETVITQIRDMLATPEMVFKTYQRARELAIGIEIDDVRSAFQQFNALWEQLFPIEQNRLIRLLIKRIDVTKEGLHISYHANGLAKVCQELKQYQAAA